MKNLPFHILNSTFFPGSRFIYRDGPPGLRNNRLPGMPGSDQDDEAEELERQEREKKEEEEKAKRTREMQNDIARAPLADDIKQLMRESLASDSLERQNLVYRVLHEKMPEQEFRNQIESAGKIDESWKAIAKTQREVRKRIQELQWRTESYAEFIPRGKIKFESVLKGIRAVNLQDDKTDRSLKSQLHALANPADPEKTVLHAEEANEIYSADPMKEGFDKTLKKYKTKISAVPNGPNIYKTLLALKREELRAERQFTILEERLERIISDNLQKVRLKGEREKLLKNASKACGVRLKEGTVIEFFAPDVVNEILTLPDDATTVSIARVTFTTAKIRDPKTGKVIDEIPGVPHIHLSNGADMTLGRFKKLIDAGEGAEKITSVDETERTLELDKYDIKIKEGMQLSYVRRKRDEQSGAISSIPTYVRIKEIHGDRVIFDEPVFFRPGLEGLEQKDEYELRESLSLGEFVKWWQRYETEKAISLQELQKLLETYNEIENKEFGYELKENPPILLDQGEELKYPDEEGRIYRITNVDTDGVTLDNGEKFTCPEFFYWVKNNHVRKLPPREKEESQKQKEKEHEAFIGETRDEKEKDITKEILDEKQRIIDIKKDEDRRAAGTPLGRLAHLFWTTQFLSLKDLFNTAKEVVEFVKRKHERRSKGRYGEVFGRLPSVLGTEFERVKQAAENEEVNKYKEAMEHWSVEKVKETLNTTNSKDEAKACVMTLLHHGEMRWDDHHFWDTLNRLTSRYTLIGAKLYIPPPHLMPPGKSGEDMTQPAMDALWGAGQAANWFQENISKYNSNKNNYEFKFKQLENDPKGTGGPAGECKRLLSVWMKGGYVNPQEYEEMIDGAIKYGKMSAEGKMFYMMAGVLARQGNADGKNPHGETLLSLDRLGELDSKYLNQFPIIDFFTTKHIKDPFTGKMRKPNKLSDYEDWMRNYFPGDFVNCEPSAEFSRFMWEVIMPNEEVRTRMSKGIRNAEQMDHDDAHLNIPPLTPTEIDQITTGPSGQKKYFTNEGYMNAFPGFNHYIISLAHVHAEEADEEKKKGYTVALRDAINSFIRFDAILDNRFKREEGDHRARLDDRHYQKKMVVDSTCILRDHQTQLRNFVKDIGKAYGEDWDWLYGDKFGLDPDGKKKQAEYERRIEELKGKINDLVARYPAKAMEVVHRAIERAEINVNDTHGLRGIKDSKRPKAEAIIELRRKAREAKEHAAHAGHGGH